MRLCQWVSAPRVHCWTWAVVELQEGPGLGSWSLRAVLLGASVLLLAFPLLGQAALPEVAELAPMGWTSETKARHTSPLALGRRVAW